MGYAKLFSSIIHSTIWEEDAHVKVVWITMLALADRTGVVEASPRGLASASRVTPEQCREALERLSAPDPDSRTKDYEGRRIEEIDGGWLLLNYEKYRDKRDMEEIREKARIRARRHREKVASRSVTQSNAPSRSVTPVTRSAPSAPAPAPATEDGSSPLIPDLIHHGEESLPCAAGAAREERFPGESAAVKAVFDYWRERTRHERAAWTEERKRHLTNRLREEPGTLGQKVAGLRLAVDGALLSPLFNGTEKGKAYLEFENLFIHKGRNRIEMLQNVARGEDLPMPGARQPTQMDDLEAQNKRAVALAIQKNRALKGLPERT
jgi:hypothetical protein